MAIVPWEFKNVKTISVGELETKLRGVKGCRAVSIVTITTPKLNKKVNGEVNPYYDRVQKRTYRSVMIGFRYENSVNNQLDRQGLEVNFTAKPRAWGKHVEGTPLISHTDKLGVGKLYLECKVQRVIDNCYYLDGEPCDDEVVEPYLPDRKPSARQAAAGVDAEKEIILIDVELKNIETIVMDGETYMMDKEEVPGNVLEAV